MKRITIGLMLFGVVAFALGCKSTFKGVEADPGFTYLRSQLSGVLQAPLPTLETATTAAMEELDFVAVDVVSDKLKGTIKARMADGTRVTVKMAAVDFESTTISIKVGTWGDQSVSVQILRHIQKQL